MIRIRGSRLLQVTTVLALMTGVVAAAQANWRNRPFRYNNYASGMQTTFVDFAVTTAAGHSGGFDTYSSPNGYGTVKYVDLGHYGGGVTGCFEYSFATANVDNSQSDLTLWAYNGSSYSKVSDDVDGVFPRFRVWVGANWLDTFQNALRISPWSPAQANSNDGQFWVKMIQLPYSQATCEATGAVVRLDNGLTVVRTSN